MKKLIFIFSVSIIAFGCGSEDDSSSEDETTQEVDPNDLDGDSIPNQQEIIDGTDPENPCDYVLDNIFFPDSTNQWRSLDCDGDGVTNGNELDPDGNNTVDISTTDPQNSCSLRVGKQTLTPSTIWRNGDCDDDSFSNAQEVTDGTDLNDPCSFTLGNQDLEQTVTFKRGDCDDDGRTNLEEIIEGTDLFDANDPNPDGTEISEIILAYSYLDPVPYWSISFTDNGSKLDEIKMEDVLKTKFHYDNSDRLYLVEKFHSTTSTENFEFFYDGLNRINSITKTTNDNGQIDSETFNYVYENNNINYYENGNLKRQVVLNANNKASNIYFFEPYYDLNIGHSRFNLSFQYSDTTEELIRISELDQHWVVMYDFYDSGPDYYSRGFGYNDTRSNDFLNCYSNIYFNFILALDIFEFHYYFNNTSAAGLFENNFQTYGSYVYAGTELYVEQQLVDFHYQPNGYPFTCKGGNYTYTGGRKYYYLYE